MRILFVKWKAYGQEILIKAFEKQGIAVDTIYYDAEKCGLLERCSFLEPLKEKIVQGNYDFVFSFNYFPVVSTACEETNLKYVAWTVDSPLYTLYTKSIFNSCNYLFVFDKSSLLELQNMGVKHVWYLPLASDAENFDALFENASKKDFHSDVSFVGNLYTDKSFYNAIGDKKKYLDGYMEGLIAAQSKIWGMSFVEEVLKANTTLGLDKILQTEDDEEYIGNTYKAFANSCILCEITARERKEYLDFAGQYVSVDVYTGSDKKVIPHTNVKGKVDYLTEMPRVFHDSRINLNITLRTIKQGISLRVWDILACGGFLLTNYQPELEEFFEIGSDLVCYFSKEDMVDKILYYLEHEEERTEIARNGYEKVKAFHSYGCRVGEMLMVLKDIE